MPVAAIESLIQLLASHPPSTISETLSLLSTHSAILKRSVRNSIPVSAGTDLFQQYLVQSLQSQPRGISGGAKLAHDKGTSISQRAAQGDDFKALRTHLMSNGRLFVARAKEARGKIAARAKHFIRDGSTVLTSGESRVVAAVLKAALAEGLRFKVVYVQSSPHLPNSSIPLPTPASPERPTDFVSVLRAASIPIAIIPSRAVAFALPKTSLVLTGAESVLENGGIINTLGTYQLGILARSAGRPFYVVVESHKFLRMYPLGQYDLGRMEQRILDFRTTSAEDAVENSAEEQEQKDREQEGGNAADMEGVVDFTPPELITALVTEDGVHTPSAVSEELINIWH